MADSTNTSTPTGQGAGDKGAPGAGDATATDTTTDKGGASGSDTFLKGGDGEQGQAGGGSKDGDAGQGGEFKLVLPDGSNLDDADVAAFTEVAKKAGVTGEQASAIAKYQIEREAAFVQKLEQQDQSWKKELEGDPDFGGEKLDATVSAANKALKQYGGDDALKVILENGLGNHPGLVKMLARIGRAMAEDDSGGDGAGGGSSAQGSREAELAERYPTMSG